MSAESRGPDPTCTRHGPERRRKDVRTVGQVRDLLSARGGAWAEALAPGRALRMAFNQQMCDAATAVADGGEVAFFPPVTGG